MTMLDKLTALSGRIAAAGMRLTVDPFDETARPRRDIPNTRIAQAESHLLMAEPEGFAPTSKLDIAGRDSTVWIAAGTVLNHCNITEHGRNNFVYIGRDCRLKQLTVQIKGSGNIVAIGAGVTVEHAVLLCGPEQRAILMGDDCMVSSNVTMRTNDGHGIFDARSGELLNAPADVAVHFHVWIGNGARLNKGCVMGAGSVLGQLSVASGVLEAGCVYAGIPARKIREGIAWSRTGRFEDVPSL